MHHETVTLSTLAARVGGRVIGPDVRIEDVEHDSRRVRPGALFVAIPGFTTDGHRFVDAAAAAGAAAVCIEHPVQVPVPQLVVAETRTVLGPLAAAVHGYPAREMAVVGVTGTNGKTMVTYFLDTILRSAGVRSALIGTIGARIGTETISLERTTPEASDLQRLLARMRDERVQAVSMEVSSHSLVLHRVDGTVFRVAAFTNLTQDHLDFHQDMDTYFNAKAQLFSPTKTREAVVFIDDPYGARLAESTRLPTTTVGFGADADIRAVSVHSGAAVSSFALVTVEGRFAVHLPIGGEFNVANALVAAGCARSVGINMNEISSGLGNVEPVPGRFEIVSGDQPVAVIVDYAHTPDGIGAAIDAARGAVPGRVIVVFGAGGDRDHGKRPLMGAAASCADIVVVTNDNPRSEDPAEIADQVASGVVGSEPLIDLDRRSAIFEAVRIAEPGDIVLILGKGHEQGQEFADRTVPFDDREVAREALEARA
ncbi:UDP-N-acetylmuramoyl-L-alanyl-D-glutamate--2, 6-diaminopimelate ligase [bacterium BMS3Abin02]|nr:UDP-N-acetylmuramoyl-L-alanyl-D-glutamate--2, 6-diaminopimelate ligase [bacterium BMS3Abin02]GBE21324.1 UDP-N-acetylmuramoyl-L-alanyl-D-glutamate--2, 6-diaminopimelate ligase [bacterium BMS3Bbin01]HDH24752.1 UDP-N-acetylmuramoyl-L-alanyl-D-glutamate--2,6-diaminopimelate ligase [Actinomycetota bacterium]HDL49127.1 UDP-N-acetylmuramoyl-L-alanyl-D-glutamate--2,6-diaminopimelate ligase [Actinomycetota bacterium]